jgi:hypothetical protein
VVVTGGGVCVDVRCVRGSEASVQGQSVGHGQVCDGRVVVVCFVVV